jgi:hypothetical protein
MADSSIRDGKDAGAAARDDAGPGRRSAFSFNGHQDRESIAELIGDLAQQGGHLAQQQQKLVQAEVRSAVRDLEESIAAMAGAAVVGIAGLGVLLMAASFLLGSVMPLWLGTLIVAAVSMIVAYALSSGGKKKLGSKAMTLDRTRHTIERAPAAMAGNGSAVRHDR